MNFIIAQIGVERLDWFGFGVSSANRTAAFIACVIVASWGFASVFKKSGFWVSLLISLVFFRFLVQTQSRGALVALIFSMAAFFYLAKIGYNKSRLSALLVGCAALAFMYFDSALSTRMTNMATLQSSSANCRADIYLSGMKMLTDAPHGVVVEKSPAEIYIRWYQNPDDSERYLSMINSHLEFLCKHGLTARICYIVFWIFALCITFPTKKDTATSAAFATWICFGLCASFSNVANFPILWIIPVAMLVFGAIYNRNRLFSAKFYKAVLLLSTFSISALYALSYALPRSQKIKFLPNGDVLCGNLKNIKYLLIVPSEKTVGVRFGGELAQFCKKRGVGALTTSLPPSGEFECALVCDAKNAVNLSAINAKRKVLLNPCADASFASLQDACITIYLGGFSDWRNRRAWKSIAENNKKIKITTLDAVADYIPDWTKYFEDENG